MKSISLILIKIIAVCLFGIGNGSAQEANFDLRSEILGENREIIVHLPEGYDADSKQGYPVIYMTDAGNDDALTAKTAHEHYLAGIMPKVIVVAIENIRRGYDFTPPYEMLGRGDDRIEGNGDKFLAFITEELIPETNRNFRTSGHNVFMGHSWGGAFASYLLSQSPNMFEGVLIYSPTFLYGSTTEESTDKLFTDLKAIFDENTELPAYIYVSVGEEEQDRYKESYQSLANFLEQHISSRVRLLFETTEGATHTENPKISIPRALSFGWR